MPEKEGSINVNPEKGDYSQTGPDMQKSSLPDFQYTPPPPQTPPAPQAPPPSNDGDSN